jgi:4,4'-diaponeurosporenoate glycosyltransferase
MTALALFGWIAGWLLFLGFRRCGSVPNESNLSGKISIVIPARDEEGNLPRLLRSIPGHQVIVVDDCSGDRTREVARHHGACIVDGTPPPNGWGGKTWASQQGANAATGDLLLFLDADTWLEADAFSKIGNELGSGAMSIAPYQYVPTVREQFSAFFNLVMIAAAGPRQLVGQSLLIRRAAYDEIGGHRAVKDEILENFALGKRLRTRSRCLLGRGVLNVRMYPNGWRELIDGWSKAFATGAARTSPVRFALIAIWINGAFLALTSPAIYALFALQLAVLLRRVGSYRALTALLYPLPLLFFCAVFARSALARTRRSVLWKGRPLHAA